jgi:hypothetical protein
MRAAWIATLTLALAVVAVPAAAQRGLDCQRCHGELELVRQHVQGLEEARSLVVPVAGREGSAHGAMACAECHDGYTAFPHGDGGRTEGCAACHEAASDAMALGSHSGSGEDGGGGAVPCAECHGLHDIAPVDALAEGDGARAMSETCVSCHETQRLAPDAHHQDHAGCHACHDPHAARPPDHPESSMAPAHQRKVCGSCHDSVAVAWSRDVHGRALAAAVADASVGGDGPGVGVGGEAPSCTACHGAHPVHGAGDRGFSEAAVERCSACHEKASETFFGSYHGKASALGSEVAATCADCHGAHGIEPTENPSSRVAEANLVETCSACHDHARPAFVLYNAHPDPMDRARNPVLFYAFWFMNALLIGTLTVFGLHTLLWWVRITIDHRKGLAHGGGEGE